MKLSICVLLSSIFVVCRFYLCTGEYTTLDYYCSGSNYTEIKGYRTDLDESLYHLMTTNNGFGFFHSVYGQANALALCRGDIDPEFCRRCMIHATRRLQQTCPHQVDAVGWYGLCFLRYSNRSRGLGYGNNITHFYADPDDVSTSIYDQWKQAVADLLSALRPEAAGSGQLRKFATGHITFSVSEKSTIYGLMQCTPDLSVKECDDCLVGATNYIRHYRSLRVTIYTPDCAIQYSDFQRFNLPWYPPASPQPSPQPSGKTKRTNIGLIIGPVLAVVSALAIVGFFVFQQLQKQNKKGRNDSSEGGNHESEDDEIGQTNSFNLSTVLVATNNFSSENKLGEGGFGPVYKGILEDGKEIAVKRLSRNSGQGLVEFKTEVQLIIKLQHKNLVRLLGYCVKGCERLLIYEYMANNSLDTFLSDPNKCQELDWAKRANIVNGIAKGLRYLHEDSRLKIVHRDMKAGNILLDEEMNSKISDFGTARIFGSNHMEEANTNRIVGTYGYMAPEYAMEGLFSTKSDVYSFGVLLLEIVSGQKNHRFVYQNQPQNLLSTAWHLWKQNKGEQLIDCHLIHSAPVSEALRWIHVALLCVQEDPQDRPTMSMVVFMVEGQWSENLPVPSEPPLLCNRFADVSEQATTTGDEITAHPSVGQTSSTTASFSLTS